MREGKPVGDFVLARKRVEAFTDRQLELVQTFADQAVIAIENARLFDEVQAKTRDLEESLQQQTATAEVLKVISRSAFDLQIVLDTLMSTAVELCEGDSSGGITVRAGEVFQYAAFYGLPDNVTAVSRSRPVVAGPATMAGRVVLEGQVVQIADIAADTDYAFADWVDAAKSAPPSACHC